MAQPPRPKVHAYPKKVKLLPAAQNWKHNIDQSFITATPSEFKIRFTKEWVEKSAKVPHALLSDPVEGSVEDFRSRLSEDSLSESGEHHHNGEEKQKSPGPHQLRHKNNNEDRKSPKLKNGEKIGERKILKTSGKDSKSPTPDPPRSHYSPAKSKSQPPPSAQTDTITSGKDSVKSPNTFFLTEDYDQHQNHRKSPPLVFDHQGHLRRATESPGHAPLPVTRSGRSANKTAPLQEARKLSSSSDSFTIEEPTKVIPKTDVQVAKSSIKNKDAVVPAVVQQPKIRTPSPETQALDHTGIVVVGTEPQKIKKDTKELRQHPLRHLKKRRPSRLGNLRLGKIRRRKVGVAFSPRESIMQEEEHPSESNVPSPSSPHKDGHSEDDKSSQNKQLSTPAGEDQKSDDGNKEAIYQNAGTGSVDVDNLDEKDSDDTSSESAIIPLRYLKPKAARIEGGVREIFFHEISGSESDSGEDDAASDRAKGSSRTTKLSAKSKLKLEAAQKEFYADGKAEGRKSELGPVSSEEHDGDKAKPRKPYTTPYASMRQFSNTFPELAMFVQRAKPSLARNPRLNWRNKPAPTVLYFESKIMPNREKFQTKFIPLLPREEKLKRLNEDNTMDEEILIALAKQMAGKGAESDQVSLVRDTASQATLPSQLDNDDKSDLKSDQDEGNKSLLHPVPPMNTPGAPSVAAVVHNNHKNVRNKNHL